MQTTGKKSGAGRKKARDQHDDPEQSKRFLKPAQAAGADETEAFKAVVKPRKSTKQRTEEAKRVVQEDIDDQRALLTKLRKQN